ncbi:MAG: pyrroline-5-carboxylate reductase [bacterium]
MQTSADTRVAFIGAGNMASAMIQGLLRSGTSAQQIRVADPVADARTRLSALGVTALSDNNEAVAEADAVVLAVKPQVAQQVMQSITVLQPEQLLVSIAAGINLASLTKWTSAQQAIVRCMPNTPALLGAGISGLYANQCVTPSQRSLAEGLLRSAGSTLWVRAEAELDAVTAVSGSGPAYFFLLMEAMIDAGVALGLDRDSATELTLQTAHGAALMAQQENTNPAQLRENVTSPGGTTAAALNVMLEADMPGTIQAALQAAQQRAIAMAQEFGGDPS